MSLTDKKELEDRLIEDILWTRLPWWQLILLRVFGYKKARKLLKIEIMVPPHSNPIDGEKPIPSGIKVAGHTYYFSPHRVEEILEELQKDK